MAKILYTVAKDSEDHLINAADAEKGSNFYCPVCSEALLLRKSGNTGKNAKRPHFAHKALTPNCNPETALHFLFKNALFSKLEDHLVNNEPLNFSWLCIHCHEKHSGNLLRKIKSIKLEHRFGECQPDITLFNQNNKVFAVIEVVVTHKPDRKTLEYYSSNDIILIQINLTSDADLNRVEEKISTPDIVSICFNPKCDKCGKFQHKTLLTIVEGPCWKCPNTMKVAIKSEFFSHSGPRDFTSEELKIAKENGVLIKKHYSKTMQESYFANTCPHCGAFSGEHYLFTDYLVPAGYGSLPSVQFNSGYHCSNCIEIQMGRDDDPDLL